MKNHYSSISSQRRNLIIALQLIVTNILSSKLLEYTENNSQSFQKNRTFDEDLAHAFLVST